MVRALASNSRTLRVRRSRSARRRDGLFSRRIWRPNAMVSAVQLFTDVLIVSANLFASLVPPPMQPEVIGRIKNATATQRRIADMTDSWLGWQMCGPIANDPSMVD